MWTAWNGASSGSVGVAVAADDLVIDALAVARLSRLVREDKILDGPRYAFVTHRHTRSWAGDFVRCPWCVSMWCGFFVAIARRVAPRWWSPVAFSLASSYCAALAAVHVEPHD